MKQRPIIPHSNWFYNYADLATQSTPINIAWWAGYVELTNDTLWARTDRTKAPLRIWDIWNPTTNSFDFSELKVWDMVDIRLDVSITTWWPSQVVDVIIETGIWTPSQWSTHFLTSTYLKSARTYNINEFIWWFIRNENMRTNPAKLKISSDWNATVKVNGFYCKITPKVN